MDQAALPSPFASLTAVPLRGALDSAGRAFLLEADDCHAEQAVVTSVSQSVLLHFPAARPCRTATLVIGGGGYIQLMAGREGVVVARWLNTLGIDAYVLVHRFPNAGNGAMAALDDARTAMAMLRGSRAGKVGVVGLSSGGHLAACLYNQPDGHRPDFGLIGYAPISTNAAGRTIVSDKAPLLPFEKQAFYDAMQPDAQMADGPPPTFLVYSASDPVVPVVNAYRLVDALEKHGGAAELHVFADAPHGFALDTLGLPVSLWPQLCVAWLHQNGLIGASDH